MQVRIFTLTFHSLLQAFDEGPLQEFVKDKEILGLRDHFFVRHGQPYLSVVVQFQPAPVPPAQTDKRTGKLRDDEKWRAIVAESDVPLFESLRAWRSERSKCEGFPPFVVCNNTHLAEIIKARPGSLAALGRIEGFGAAKLEKYGKDILAIVAQAAQLTPAKTESKPEESQTEPAQMPLLEETENGN